MAVAEVVGFIFVILATGCTAVLVGAETSLLHIGRARAEVIGDGVGGDDRVEDLLALLDRRPESLRPVALALVVSRMVLVSLVVSWVYSRFGAG